jgi:hypothetical protein
MGSASQWLGCQVLMPPDLPTPFGVNAFGRSALTSVVTPISQLHSAYRPPRTAGPRGGRRRRWGNACAFNDDIAAPVTKWRCTMPIRAAR